MGLIRWCDCDVDGAVPRLFYVTDRDVRDGALLIQTRFDVRVVDERVARRLQLDAAIETPETFNPVEQTLATRDVVANFGGEGDGFAGADEIRDVELLGAAIVLDLRDVLAIHPESAGGVDAADGEPDLLVLPAGRNVDAFAIPRGADVAAVER